MTPVPDHTVAVVTAMTFLAVISIGCATFLLATGYQSGELLVGIASAATGSLGTLLAIRRLPNSNQTANEITNNPTPPIVDPPL